MNIPFQLGLTLLLCVVAMFAVPTLVSQPDTVYTIAGFLLLIAVPTVVYYIWK